ncbi:MAG: thymidine phosphorylase [Bacillota bacterium]
MRAVDLIAKKRDGHQLTDAELQALVDGFLQGSIPDYQMSAWLMAVYLRGMTMSETVALTRIMLQSGHQVSLQGFSQPTVDKHSTGGVGDKISLVLAPLLAAAGLAVGKLTGRGLGHTGGTVDKLESIPGFRTELTEEQYFHTLQQIGVCMISAGPTLAPADKRIYALRDVTATVDCLPLIASSIMSKKLAGGAEHILLDVKCGRGAFLADLNEAAQLANMMIDIGRSCNRQVRAVISSMDQPLGLAVGNSLEVQEAIAVLKGGGPADVRELTICLGSELLQSAKGYSDLQAEQSLVELLDSGAAWEKFRQLVAAQGGDLSFVDQPARLPRARLERPVLAMQPGYVRSLDALTIGRAAMLAGAGRARQEDQIDYGAGVLLHKKCGDYVQPGEALATVYAQDKVMLQAAAELAQSAWQFSSQRCEQPPLILSRYR